MKKNTTMMLARELFHLIKQLPRPKLKQNSADGLTRSEYELLVMLVMSRGGENLAFTVTEISSRLQITPAGVTHLINPLEEAGYIERLQDRKDRRIVRIGITEKGTQVANALISEIQENLSGLINYLGEEDSKTFIRLMSKAIEFFSSRLEN